MHRILLALFVAAWASATHAAEWRMQHVDAPARVSAVETVGQVRVNAGGLWYRIVFNDEQVSLEFIDTQGRQSCPRAPCPTARSSTGSRDIARAWLAEPTTRYDHGILGDKIEAGSLVIETRDGKRQTVRLKPDAVFEDLEPRLADLDGDGHDEIVVVKSSLKRGSSLAVIAARRGKYEIIAETPPLGAPHRWLDPAGIADFTGGGKRSIALVRQPHVIGALELWSWRGGALRKISRAARHRQPHRRHARDRHGGALPISTATASPISPRPRSTARDLRIVSFAPRPREIASVAATGEGDDQSRPGGAN